jgi:hypothetical protein
MYAKGWTDLKVGGQFLMMKNGQVGLRNHEQMTTALKWKH